MAKKKKEKKRDYATVTFTITDKPETPEEEGTINFRIESDPPWPGPAAKDQTLTAAQACGLRLMEALPELMKAMRGLQEEKKKK